ncbi:MAG: tryptophan--tRNA ligase [Candidatus Micrarchaeota archaeon]
MKKDFTVTPWKVEGEIDYERLIKEFGTEHITDPLLERIRKLAGDLHPFLRRKIFFSHRDLNWLLDEYEKGNKFFLYTGRGPSGSTHIGHLIPWMFTKWLQDRFGADLWFQLTDDEKFLFKENLSLEKANSLAYENALDVIAVGFKPGKTFIFTDTDYARTLYPQALKVAKKLTLSTTKAVFGFTDSSNVGEAFFTSMQSVPAFLPSISKGCNIPCLIPHAIDQDAHFRVSRDILPKLGYYKPAAIHCRFLPGLTSNKKMSASEADTAIYTTDSPEMIEKKIKKYAFSGGAASVEEHRKKGGDPSVDVPYQWLTFFEEDDAKLNAIHDDYKSGKLLSGEMKLMLIEKLQAFLKGHQRKREDARKVLDKFILKD